MKKFVLFVLLLLLASVGDVSAQQERIDPDPLLVDRIKETVFTLNGYITDMVGECGIQPREECYRNRNRIKDFALSLFVGRGESYVLDGVRKAPVRMETAIISASGQKRISTNYVTVYFQRLIGLVSGGRYVNVSLISGDWFDVHVGSIRPIAEKLYEFTVVCGQWSNGERGEIVANQYKEIAMVGYLKCCCGMCDVLLGDTKCSEVHRL